MQNLGIIVAASKYVSFGDLPACIKDGRAIADALSQAKKYDDVLTIVDQNSATTKQGIVDFVNKHKDSDIGEIFFYFTGHGEFFGGEFYYVLSDFDQKKRKQTSLENSELDDLVRNLAPRLFVKIVDACNSGISYIKNPEEFKDYLKSAGTNFKNIYFMFSSQAEQSSYQDRNLSYFTRTIIEAITSHSSPIIRYKDIIDYVSDAFEQETVQTPFFVTQAGFTESFCRSSNELIETLLSYLRADQPGSSPAQIPGKTLLEQLRIDAERYCTPEEALRNLEHFTKILCDIRLDGDVGNIFSVSASRESSSPPNEAAIGSWFDQNREDKKYFVVVQSEMQTKTKRVPKDPMQSLFKIRVLGDEELATVTELRRVITGFISTGNMSFNHVKIMAEPAFPNVSASAGFVVPLLSMTHLRAFWAFVEFEAVGWQERRLDAPVEWKSDEVSLKDATGLAAFAERIKEEFAAFVSGPLYERWGQQGRADQDEDPGDGRDSGKDEGGAAIP